VRRAAPPPPPLFPPVEKREIKDKPAKYGVYIYRDGKFLRLPQAPVAYSGVWFGISLSSRLLAASFVPENELGEMPQYQEGDLIAIHYKGADRATWYYYPLTHFPLIDFPGNNEAELWRRPAGYYLGFSAVGHPQNLFQLFSRAYEDGYRFDQQRIRGDDVVYSDNAIVFARMRHIPDLPISRFLLTNKSVGFDEPSDYNRLLTQLPEDGVLFDMEPARQMDNFEGRRDYIERYNRDTAVRHLVTAKEFTLEPGKIVDTGIYIMDPSFVRFMSDNDFALVLRQGDWQETRGWMPPDIDFGKLSDPIPLTDSASHVIGQRHFALRYLARSPHTQVRLMGLRRAARVTVVYSPIFAYDIAYHEFVRIGYEHFEAHRYDQAVEAYEKALEMQPEYPHALNNLAWLYATATNPDFFDPKKSLDLAIKAGRFRPVKPFILDTISKAFFLNGDLDRAIELEEMAYGDSAAYSAHYNERMAIYNNVKQHMDKARAAERVQDWEEAIKQLHFSVEKMPNYFMGLNRLAWLYATVPDKDLQDGHLALDYSRSALAIAPDRAIIWDTMAEAFASIDEADKALECARRARHFEPLDPYFQERYEKFKKAAE
jgi:tetratricopeptide (TPR) repeat protein